MCSMFPLKGFHKKRKRINSTANLIYYFLSFLEVLVSLIKKTPTTRAKLQVNSPWGEGVPIYIFGRKYNFLNVSEIAGYPISE